MFSDTSRKSRCRLLQGERGGKPISLLEYKNCAPLGPSQKSRSQVSQKGLQLEDRAQRDPQTSSLYIIIVQLFINQYIPNNCNPNFEAKYLVVFFVFASKQYQACFDANTKVNNRIKKLYLHQQVTEDTNTKYKYKYKSTIE